MHPKKNPVDSSDAVTAGLAVAIADGENLGPIIRRAFASGNSGALLQGLANVVRKKDIEIEELCKDHYGEFILAVDDLRGVLSDAADLKGHLSAETLRLQDVASTLLLKVEQLLELYSVKKNAANAMATLKACVEVSRLCAACNKHIVEGQLYAALKTLDLIGTVYLQRVPIKAFRTAIERQMPRMRMHIEQKVREEICAWLVYIRGKTREIGQSVHGMASAARKRCEESRSKQREAEEECRSGINSFAFSLDTELADGDPLPEFDLSPVYRAYSIHQCLGTAERLREYYFENRMMQLEQYLEISSAQPFLESHQGFFAEITGFLVVEDRVLRTAGGLLSENQAQTMWDTALSRIRSVLEAQFAAMDTASHLLLVKDYVALVGDALRRHGFRVSALVEILESSSDRYHELLFKDCRDQIAEMLKSDTYDRMGVKTEYEYTASVAAFGLQPPEGAPEFPYSAPFSASVPEICRGVKSFIEASASYLWFGKIGSCYDSVKQYLDKLLIEVLNDELMSAVHGGSLSMEQTMQLAANVGVLEHACDFFLSQAARHSGMPRQIAQKPHSGLTAKAVLKASQNVTYNAILGMVNSKLDEYMVVVASSIDWTAEAPPEHRNDYMNEILISLHDVVSLAQKILLPEALYKVVSGALGHISDSIVMAFLNDRLKRFTIGAVIGFDNDLRALEDFADERFSSTGASELGREPTFRDCLAEARQLIDLLRSNQPEGFANVAIRETTYGALDQKKVAAICEKFRDSPEGLFGGLAGRGAKSNNRKKSMDVLKKRLREFS